MDIRKFTSTMFDLQKHDLLFKTEILQSISRVTVSRRNNNGMMLKLVQIFIVVSCNVQGSVLPILIPMIIPMP